MRRRRLSHAIALAGALAGALAAILLPAAAGAAAPSDLEPERVRAALIDRVARFVEWPGTPSSQFVLCVADEHPQLAYLRSYYDSATIAALPVQVRPLRKNETLAGCHAAILVPGETADINRMRSQADQAHVLLFGEGTGMARHGVHIGFYPGAKHMVLEVNRKSLEASGLKASFRLLEVAKIVE
ncbi:MAG: YfiR family protein [Pseudomonadota bacterium]